MQEKEQAQKGRRYLWKCVLASHAVCQGTADNKQLTYTETSPVMISLSFPSPDEGFAQFQVQTKTNNVLEMKKRKHASHTYIV